jgi:hypothetical protein
VRLWFKWVPEKEQYVNQTIGNTRSQLLVTAEWAAAQAFNIEPRMFVNNATGGSGAHQDVVAQFIAVVHRPFQHLRLHIVVSNEGNTFLGTRENAS